MRGILSFSNNELTWNMPQKDLHIPESFPVNERILSIRKSLKGWWLLLLVAGLAGVLLILAHLISPEFRLSKIAMVFVISLQGAVACILFFVGKIWMRRFDDLYHAASGIGKNVLVYGAGTTGMIVQRVIQKDRTRQFRILSFLDDNPLIRRNRIRGVPVIQLSEITRE